MDLHHREQELRLDILEAIARSQHALADMAEKIASAYQIHNPEDDELARQLMVLAGYQLSLAEKILRLRIRHKRFGRPCAPWLMDDVRIRWKGKIKGQRRKWRIRKISMAIEKGRF